MFRAIVPAVRLEYSTGGPRLIFHHPKHIQYSTHFSLSSTVHTVLYSIVPRGVVQYGTTGQCNSVDANAKRTDCSVQRNHTALPFTLGVPFH